MPGHELVGKEELQEVKRIFESGGVLFRRGFETRRCGVYCVEQFEGMFAERMKVPHALAVSSGTAALRVALAAFGVKEGDEVITQSFTFVATVEAIIECGATPVCVEIDSSLNMCPRALEDAITERTRCVIPVHMLGIPARMKEIKEVCERRGLFLLEDAAWGCGGAIDGQALGTLGDAGAYSFDFAKTMTTGEGGMVVFKDKELFKRACAWHDHGHDNNPTVPRWEDTRNSRGFNYRMTELQGAVGIAQLRKLEYIVEKQRENKRRLIEALEGLQVRLRDAPDNSYETADGLVLMLETPEAAKRCRDLLNNKGHATKILPEAITWHFAGTWSHMKELTDRHSDLSSSFATSKAYLDKCICLPVGISLKEEDIGCIKSCIEIALLNNS